MKKWVIRLGTPFLTLALISACGTTNDNNNEPQDNNEPESEDQNYNDTRHNNNQNRENHDRNQSIDDMGVPNKTYDENRDYNH